ncbi:long-chain fatty acid transport protein 2-like [Myiozetetes cayanensis]|uniref:long-chain fatty acid transport protein 2-like n=1 Tax=Myiozetetes cayanensis TaxID=478635 RepID=UPI00215E4B6B|nr:long-chain fatty acid transport protein 2-like [Myiozetetes cayanensis]
MAVLLGLLTAALAGLALLLAPPFLWDDLVAFVSMARSALRCRRRFARSPPETLLDVFLLHARRRPQQPLLRFQDELYTYEDVDLRSNRAAWVLQRHLRLSPGVTVAVFLPNSPTYVWTWLALAKLGCVMACVNTNARGQALRHALEAAGATLLLTSQELQGAVEEVLPGLHRSGVRVFYLSPCSPTSGVPALLPDIEAAPADPVPAQYRAGITATSKAMYIYTSGTTGLPKAAVVTELKLMMAATLARMCGLRRDDIVYTTLPLYHSAGLLVGLGGCLDVGATCVLRSKFSASQFWADCRKYNVTVIQYVGELMRYLCNTPPRPDDREHGVRLALGNGMKAEVWKEFLRRFGPVAIWEFYGATEGNAGFINYTGKVGAVGRSNIFLKPFAPFELIKYDVAADEPVRDERGLCIPVGPGETGLLVVKITQNAPFHGYAGDAAKTEKKVLRDVLAKGDAFFNSGDLLLMDRQRFLYFQDRVGDTFRWKGENVATTEVEATLAAVGFIQEVNVYGVAVPGCEGRCGMAAVRLKDGATFDGDTLFAFTQDTLPPYAAPRFIRVQDALEITGTFKQCKSNLVREGFDPQLVQDPLFFRDNSRRSYVPLTQATFDAIQAMRLSL